MKACRAASVVAFAALGALLAIAACRDVSAPDAPKSVPSSSSPGAPPLAPAESGPASALAPAPFAPFAPAASLPPPSSAPASSAPASATTAAPFGPPPEGAPSVSFVTAPTKLADGLCQTLLLASVKGSLSAYGKTLVPGDVLVVDHALPEPLEGSGLAVSALSPRRPCAVRSRPAPEVSLIRGTTAPKLTWAGGAMSAHLDVSKTVSPSLYLGRLEGSAAVAEHSHPGSWEILAAVDAAGTFTLDGQPARLGPKQIVVVAPGTKHSWTPDPGSTLVAIQLYSPPGPEQRFRALADAGL